MKTPGELTRLMLTWEIPLGDLTQVDTDGCTTNDVHDDDPRQEHLSRGDEGETQCVKKMNKEKETGHGSKN